MVGRNTATVSALILYRVHDPGDSRKPRAAPGDRPSWNRTGSNPDGIVDTDAYYLKVGLPGRRRPPFTIRATELREMGIEMLLGMNIIRLVRLPITENRFVFTLEEPVS